MPITRVEGKYSASANRMSGTDSPTAEDHPDEVSYPVKN